MNALRQLGLFITGSVLSISLFMVVFCIGLVTIVTNPTKIKSTLHDSGVYDTLVSNIIKETTKKQAAEHDENSVPLDQAEITNAAEKAFSPALLQQSAENFIDGTYRWLEGKVAKPDFVIDLTSAKADFINNVAEYTKTRALTLPVCAPGQTPPELDIMTATCLPKGYNVDAEVTKVKSELSSGDFFSDPVVTVDNFSGPKEGDTANQPFAEKYSYLPKYYQKLPLLPIIFGVLSLLSAGIIILISKTKRKGLNRVAITLIVAGAILLGSVLLIKFGVDRVRQTAVDAQTADALKEKLIWFVDRLGEDLKQPYLVFGIIYAILGVSILVALKFIRPQKHLEDVATPDGHKPANPTTPTSQTTTHDNKPDKKSN